MSKVQTDNSHLLLKRDIRAQSIKGLKNPKVLECYAGNSNLWECSTTRIDKRKGLRGVYLQGDNVKFLMSMDLSQFNVIDLDAYGIPFDQLQIIFNKKFKGIVHVTFIQTGMGRLPNGFLELLGYTHEMIEKCPTIFSRNGVEKLYNYLSMNGVKKVYIASDNRKHYLYFKL